jgi:hypothetical protein
MGAGCGCRSFMASPKCHLAPVCSVEDVTLNARSRLIGPLDTICRIFHEFGKIVHGCKTLSHSGKRRRYSSECPLHAPAAPFLVARLRSGRRAASAAAAVSEDATLVREHQKEASACAAPSSRKVASTVVRTTSSARVPLWRQQAASCY